MPDESKAMPSRPAKIKGADFGPAYATLFEGPQQSLARWLQGTFALSEEIAQFAQNRMQEDMAAWVALAACRSPEDAVNCQRQFAEKMVAQYREEVNRLSQMMMTVAGTGLSTLQPKAPPAV